MKQAIIVFQKNPVPGKTKTRLAATIGNEKALEVYRHLVEHAHQQVANLTAEKYLFFSDRIEDDYVAHYQCFVQEGEDLGERMKNALDQVLKTVDSAVLIGTDCFELTTQILEEALEALRTHDYCLGPAHDGGYYLIGCKKTSDEVFLNKIWSTDSVCSEALENLKKLRLTCALLPTLTDCDTEEDLRKVKGNLVW